MMQAILSERSLRGAHFELSLAALALMLPHMALRVVAAARLQAACKHICVVDSCCSDPPLHTRSPVGATGRDLVAVLAGRSLGTAGQPRWPDQGFWSHAYETGKRQTYHCVNLDHPTTAGSRLPVPILQEASTSL